MSKNTKIGCTEMYEFKKVSGLNSSAGAFILVRYKYKLNQTNPSTQYDLLFYWLPLP